jgi:hypothetical protein
VAHTADVDLDTQSGDNPAARQLLKAHHALEPIGVAQSHSFQFVLFVFLAVVVVIAFLVALSPSNDSHACEG